MNAVESNSTPHSAEASGNGAKHPPESAATKRPAAEKPPEDLSETAFLEQESEAAKAAVIQTLQDLKGDLVAAVDVRQWAQVHPWAVVGVAAAVGFVAAAATGVPPPEEKEPSEPPPPHRPKRHGRKPAPPGRLAWLWPHVTDLAKTAVTVLISSTVQSAQAMAQAAAPPAEEPTENRPAAAGD